MTLRPLLLATLLLIAGGAAPAAGASIPAERDAALSAPAPAPGATANSTGLQAGTPAADAPAYAARLRAETDAVLAGPDFRQRETMHYPVLRDWLRKWLRRGDSKPAPSQGPDLRLLATAFQYLAVALLALALAWLLWRGWQWLAPQVSRRPRGQARAIADVQRLALPGAPLPDAVTAAAAAAWHAGDAALALSLLYRGAVRGLARDHGIELPDSATEGECLRVARQSGAAIVPAGFAPIVQAWMALAYARRAPADFEALLALYARHFETDAEGAAP